MSQTQGTAPISNLWIIAGCALILMSGLIIALMIAPAFGGPRSAKGGREAQGQDEVDALVALNTAVVATLAAKRDTAQSELDAFECTGALEDASLPQSISPAKKARVDVLKSRLEEAVVFIATETGTGTGFFVSTDTILTNAHVVKGASTVRVGNAALWGNAPKQGQVIARDGGSTKIGSRDYALVTLAEPELDAVILPQAQTISPLDFVAAAGFPGLYQGLDESGTPKLILRSGEFIDSFEQKGGISVLAHSAEIFPGNSGGPLVNACADIIGINTFFTWRAITKEKEGGPMHKTDFALPSEDFAKFLSANGITLATSTTECD